VEKSAAVPVEKALAGCSSGEGRREAQWRKRRDGEEDERERAVEREALWREGGQEAQWRWLAGCAAERGHRLMVPW
jgi:hypothetical protein